MPSLGDFRRTLRRGSVIASLAIVCGVVMLAVASRERKPSSAVGSGATPLAVGAARQATAPPGAAPATKTTPEAHEGRAASGPGTLPRLAVSPRSAPTSVRPSVAPVAADHAGPQIAAALLAEAAGARRQGDLRTSLALLREAARRAPSVETHAALGGLYFELGAVRAAEPSLRAAAEGDPGNADRWIALANALALKPDPMAAAGALEHAQAVEPALRVGRDPSGRLVRVSPH